jgi:hypothetical protein
LIRNLALSSCLDFYEPFGIVQHTSWVITEKKGVPGKFLETSQIFVMLLRRPVIEYLPKKYERKAKLEIIDPKKNVLRYDTQRLTIWLNK